MVNWLGTSIQKLKKNMVPVQSASGPGAGKRPGCWAPLVYSIGSLVPLFESQQRLMICVICTIGINVTTHKQARQQDRLPHEHHTNHK